MVTSFVGLLNKFCYANIFELRTHYDKLGCAHSVKLIRGSRFINIVITQEMFYQLPAKNLLAYVISTIPHDLWLEPATQTQKYYSFGKQGGKTAKYHALVDHHGNVGFKTGGIIGGHKNHLHFEQESVGNFKNEIEQHKKALLADVDNSVTHHLDQFFDLKQIVKYPCDCNYKNKSLSEAIVHMNDDHEWSRQDVAEWMKNDKTIDTKLKEQA